MSLNIAARALTTNLAVLQTIWHNIAKGNTVGYSRQTATLQQVPGQQLGNGYFGKGVEISAVERSYDAFLTRQANSTQTVASADAVHLQKMQQVESLFPLGEGSLGTMLNQTLNAWADVQESPADSTARGVVISSADALAARIRETFTRLEEIGTTARLQASEVVKDINSMAKQVADLNEKIARVQNSAAVPNDLLDQRDKLLADLGKKIQITTIGAEDGSTSVFVAGSQPLVLGNKAASLSAERAPLDGDNRQVISFVQGGVKHEIPGEFLGGGELKGLQDFINKDLSMTQASLGRMALTLATEVNMQHHSGLDINGAPGGDFFSLPTMRVIAESGYAGAIPTLTLDDATQLAPTDYEVTFDASGANATIRRISDGSSFSGAVPMSFDGLTLSGGGDPNSRFLLRPSSDYGRSMQVQLSSPSDLAVASSVSLVPGAGNGDDVTVETAVQIAFPADPLPIGISFDGAGQISVGGAPFQPFTPGQPIEAGGYRITLRGTPAATDTFSLEAPAPGATRFSGGNAQAMLALRDKMVFDGSTSLSDGYVPVFSNVASKVSEVKFSAQFSATQAAAAETQRANQAGVNLDEEAAKLIQYQQAYQASAKYMGTVQSLFDTLMSAFR